MLRLAASESANARLWVSKGLRHAVRRYLVRHRQDKLTIRVAVTMTDATSAPQAETIDLPIRTLPNYR
jgi:hypothetical protein